MKDYMLSERLQNTFKNSTVCVLDKTSYLGLHSPRKNLLTDVLHKYKKALFSISILSIFKCFYFVDVSPNSIIKPQRRECFIQSVQLI